MLQIAVAPSLHPNSFQRRGGGAHVCGQCSGDTVINWTWHEQDVTPCAGLLHSSLGGGGILSTMLHSPLPYHTTTAASVGYYIKYFQYFDIEQKFSTSVHLLASSMIVENTEDYNPISTGHCLASWIFCFSSQNYCHDCTFLYLEHCSIC